MADCAGALKELTIKTGVVKRLIKELNSYQKEAEKESMKLEAMKAQGDTTDRYAIKKQAEIVEDTQQMIPNCSRRLAKSLDDLKKVLEDYKMTLESKPQYADAMEQVKAGSEVCAGVGMPKS